MIYLLVRWPHTATDCPILMYSEIGADRYETRKVDVFIDGRVELGGDDVDVGDTSDQPIPEIEAIEANPEGFVAREICQEEFEAIWQVARNICRSDA